MIRDQLIGAKLDWAFLAGPWERVVREYHQPYRNISTALDRALGIALGAPVGASVGTTQGTPLGKSLGNGLDSELFHARPHR